MTNLLDISHPEQLFAKPMASKLTTMTSQGSITNKFFFTQEEVIICDHIDMRTISTSQADKEVKKTHADELSQLIGRIGQVSCQSGYVGNET